MVHPSGRKAYYFLYRHKVDRKQRLKVGVHGHITCDIAREIVRGWAGDLARGIDPKEHNKKQEIQEKQSITMEVFLKIFMEKHKSVHNKVGTVKQDGMRIKNTILPFMGEKRVADVSGEDILKLQDQLKGTPIQFNRCFGILSKAFNLAELWNYRPKNSNPCRGIQKYPEKKKERFLTLEELENLDGILKQQEAFKITSPYSLAAIRMLMYTGCRLSEILTLQWGDVFLDDGYLYLKDSKTGERKIPLNGTAKALLASLKQEKGNPYVFVGEKPGTCLTTLKRAWSKIRVLANLKGVRIHDLRHTFASLAIKQGVDLYTVSKLLGHKNIHTTTRYAHLEIKQLISATNKLDEIWKGQDPSE
jgi:integrase